MRNLTAIVKPERGESFIRAAFATLVAHVNANQRRAGANTAAEACRELFPNDRAALALVTRSATDLGTTDGWGADLAAAGAQDFVGSLAPYSAISRLMGHGITINLDNGPAPVPKRSTNPQAYGLVGEGDPIPVRAASLSSVSLTPGKVGGIVALSRELAKRGDGQRVIATILREDAGASLDAAYLSTTAGGLLAGVTPIPYDVAFGVEALRNDLANVAGSAASAGAGEATIIVSPKRLARISVLAPDIRIPVLASIAIPDDRVIAVDGSALVHGFGSIPEITASNAAVLHMADDPAEIVSAAPATAGPVRSMYQTNGIALRMVLDVAFGKRSAGAVAYVDGVVNW